VSQEIDRRAFVGAAAATVLPLFGASRSWGLADDAAYPGPIVRQQEPPNLELPFRTLDSFLTPNERFFTRCHFPMPKIDAATWKLTVEGAVEKRLELGYEELRGMASRKLVALLECAGNAVEVVLEGADKGAIRSEPPSPGEIQFARALPLARARNPDVLLAHQMNGADLPVAHGFPVRALVAGWYGMASVKWLTRILVTDRPFQGFFQTFDYSYFERRDGLPNVVPITVQHVKAEIARPARFEVLPRGQAYRIHGAAWAGESEVRKVEISTDGGKSWNPARLLGEPVRYAWRFWEYRWRTPEEAGKHTLMARATDAWNRVQPMRRDPDRRNYLITHVLPIEVEVR
jgi:DMSO/TMAO reductase YedYZ molybdopterin-dependent catalytic subunit